MTDSSMDKLLAEMHTALGQALLDKIQNGKATAGDLNVARQFLKDNGIDILAKRSKNLQKLGDILPFQDPETPISNTGT